MGDAFKRQVKPRLNWDEYFLKIAMLVAERSTCRRHHVGALIVKNKQILSTGYNGAAAGLKDCYELGCLKDELDIDHGKGHDMCRAIHAEQNAIIQAALHGVNIEGATVYCTHSMCGLCAKMMINARIKRFVSFTDYEDKETAKVFKEAGVEVVKLKRPDTTIYIKE
jgi:dCMP deaminase